MCDAAKLMTGLEGISVPRAEASYTPRRIVSNDLMGVKLNTKTAVCTREAP